MTTLPITASNQAASTTARPRPHWLSQAWLEPRFVALTGLALVLSWVGGAAQWSPTLMGALGLLAFITGGTFGTLGALQALRERRIDVDLLMILAALGAALIGNWPEGALLLFLFSLSNVLQDYAIGRSRQAIQSLFKLYPEQANVRRDGQVLQLKASEIRLEDVVLIAPGERIPVDGQVIEGRSAVDQSPITGESMPVEKGVGDVVFAGTLNKQGSLDVRATKLATQSTLARIIQLVEEAQDRKAPAEQFLEVFEQRYAMVILAAVALFIVVPPLFFGAEFSSNFYRAMVLMTVASPCALVISVPAAYISAIASAARMGVLLKGGAYLEQLAAVRAIAFDKTGTLTVGEPRLTAIHAIGMDENSLLRLAAAAEARSEHPLAQAVLDAAAERGLALPAISDFEAEVGRGVLATVAGQRVQIGRISHLSAQSPLPAALAQAVTAEEAEGQTTMGVLVDGAWAGVLALADQVRPTAAQAIRELRAMGVEPVMLTGDNPSVAAHIAAQIGLTEFKASLLPEDKVTAIHDLLSRYGQVAMVGDGVNDAPALATASVGIAMGAAGTDVAMETADMVLMADRIERIPAAIQLARRARRVVWQNISFSLAVIVLLILGAFAINLPLPLGVLGHEGSTVIVVLNGLISLLLLPELQRRRAAQQG